MKLLSSKLGIIATAALLSSALAWTAHAQASHLLRVHVPFAFLAGDQTLPAGDYLVKVDPRLNVIDLLPRENNEIHRLLLRHDFVKRPASNLDDGLLTFAKYGNQFVLRGVWTDGAAEGHEVVPSKAEIELSKNTGGAPTAGAEVMLESR
jgi:hypothetical protein